jgi:hypothetical protein
MLTTKTRVTSRGTIGTSRTRVCGVTSVTLRRGHGYIIAGTAGVEANGVRATEVVIDVTDMLTTPPCRCTSALMTKTDAVCRQGRRVMLISL